MTAKRGNMRKKQCSKASAPVREEVSAQPAMILPAPALHPCAALKTSLATCLTPAVIRLIFSWFICGMKDDHLGTPQQHPSEQARPSRWLRPAVRPPEQQGTTTRRCAPPGWRSQRPLQPLHQRHHRPAPPIDRMAADSAAEAPADRPPDSPSKEAQEPATRGFFLVRCWSLPPRRLLPSASAAWP